MRRPLVPAVIVLVLVALLAAGCAGAPTGEGAPSGEASTVDIPAAIASESPSAPTELTVGGDRPARVVVPPDPDPSGAPLLIVLHGYGSSGRDHEAYFRFGPAAAERGMVVAWPDGTLDRNGDRFWNATDACCDFDRVGVADDAYVAGLIDEIAAAVEIDPQRVYVIGHSNGGFMSHRMACDHADLVAGIMSLAGTAPGQPAACAPSGPVAILQVHGTADDVIRFDGGTLQLDRGADVEPLGAYPGAAATVQAWAAIDGCEPELIDVPTRIDVAASMDGPDGPAESEVAAATGCAPGGAAELWTIPGGGHDPDLADAFPAAVLDFLLAHPKP